MDLRLVFASHNNNKAKEIQSIMPQGVHVLSLDDIGCEEDIPETGETLEENALLKARYVWEKFGMNCFADDTGLLVDALNGEPGVYSARYAGAQKDPNDNMDLLLSKLGDSDYRNARFKTAMALILHGEEYVFNGTVEGHIINEKRGNEGFGYDPIFEPENSGKTFAEMNMTEKNQMSHRARALEKMIHFLIKDNYSHNL
jgi:XTP/dITP diphosphohydrolase